MAVSGKGALSFRVIARVGKGEQVMVCGDAPCLGSGDPERALPLFTTPADYPLWFSKEELPRPAGSKTAHDFRYCVYRGGRFYRWDAVEQPRVIRSSKTPQIARDTLDEDPKDNESESGRHDRLSPDIASPGPPGPEEEQEKTWLQTPSFTKSKTAATAAAFLQEGGCVPLSPGGGEDNESEDGVASLQFAAQELSRRQLHQQQREGGIGEVLGRLRRPPSLEAVDGEEAGLGLGLRLGMEALSSPPPMRAAAEKAKAKACPTLWSSKDGGVVVASFYLPVTLTRRTASDTSGETEGVPEANADGDGGGGAGCDGWVAEWDHEQLIAMQTNLRVVRVGTVKCDENIEEEDKPAVVKALLKLNCVPVFLTESITHQCYYSYCKGVLWPVMHGMLEMYDDLPNSLLDDAAITQGWQAYKQVNRAFRDKVVEVFHEGDMIWIHGFHLAILPAFLDRTVKVARIGLFLHTPFPPGEVFRALPHREDLLRGMLGADQVGFHRFSDSQHFMTSCRRLLGLTHLHSQETGLIQIVHGAKPTILTARHAGVDPDAVRASLGEEGSREEVARLTGLHGDRVVVAGVERVEKIKGVWLKLLAFEDMLRRYPGLVGRVSMHEVGIANPARGSDYRACQESLSELADRMNAKHGAGTVIYEERDPKDATLARRAALMSVSSVFVKTPVHNGLSTMPIEFRVVQEHLRAEARDKQLSGASPGVLILSEAVSCSPAMRGSLSVNPWQVEAVADAMADAVMAEAGERVALHEEDIEWCETNTTAQWAEDVLGVLTTVPKENRNRYATTGLGLTSRVVGTDPTFKRLDTNCARRAYGASKQRVFLLDYGGTLVKDSPIAQPRAMDVKADFDRRKSKAAGLRPGRAVQEGLAELCRDPCNIVFVVSGRGKDELQAAFGHIKGLGLAAEHGSFYRWPSNDRESGGVGVGGDGWEALHPGLMDTAWKSVARRFMQNFQVHTHGSYIEEKGTAMLWHYGDAEPEFGAMQARTCLQDELTDVLRFSGATNTPVEGVLFAGTTPAGTTTGVVGGGGGGGGGGIENINICKNSGSSKAASMSKMMMGLNVNVSTTAVTGSTRSNSVASFASEGFGAIEITHEDGLNSGTGSGGAYLEVRARGANKGNFVHMVLDRLGWPSEVSSFPAPADATDTDAAVSTASSAGGRFCLCVGDDVSDEEMFIAVKSYEGVATSKGQCSVGPSASPASAPFHTDGPRAEAAPAFTPPSVLPTGKENMTPAAESGRHQAMQQQQQQQQQQQPQTHLFTVTVGSKPSDADAWLPGVPAVVSLLRILGRVTSRHGTAQRSMLAPRAAAVGISNSPMLEPHRGMTQSVSPTRSFRSASASNADAGDATASGTTVKNHSSMASFADGGGAFDPIPEVSMAVRAMNVGQGMPVVRRHSYTIGGKPRISLSLAEFLQSVAQPESEPPSF
ncbi:unnamed protein product [Ectocarpus sp. 6 AP-2014]